MKISVTHKLAVCRFQLWLLLDIFGTAFSQSGQQTVFKKSLFHRIFRGIHTQVQKYILQTSGDLHFTKCIVRLYNKGYQSVLLTLQHRHI